MNDIQFQTLPIICPSVLKEKRTPPSIVPDLLIRLPNIEEIRKRYKPSILSPLRQRPN